MIMNTDFNRWWHEIQEVTDKISFCQNRTFSFGEYNFTIKFNFEKTEFFTQAIAHLEQDFVNSDYEIMVINSPLTDMPLWFIEKYYESILLNHYLTSNEKRFVLHYRSYDKNLIEIKLIDIVNRKAVFWFPNIKVIPEHERSFPFRQILHHFLHGSEYCMIHGAVVGKGNEGILITAKGGSGKSTAAVACLQSNWQYAGDDFVLYNSKNNMVYSLYNVAKLEPHQLKYFEYLAGVIYPNQFDMHKQQMFLYPDFKLLICSKMQLKAIVIPKYDPKLESSLISPASKAQTLLCMAPSTMMLLKSDDGLFAKLTDLCNKMPTYTLHSSSNVSSIPLALETIL